MGIGKKMSKGSIGGGVNISHKSKMSQSAKNQMSFPGGMPGPGDYGKVVGKGMAQYMAGEAVGMKKYGAHKGTAKMDPMHNGEPGVQKEDFQQFSDGPAKKTVKSVSGINDKKDNYKYQEPKAETLKSTKTSKRKPSKEIGKSKIEEGKKLKKEGRQEKRAARKDARKSKRSARLDKKIALQEFKGKQKLKSGDKLGAKAKQDRIANLKARKAKK
jgi:hypothetical protein